MLDKVISGFFTILDIKLTDLQDCFYCLPTYSRLQPGAGLMVSVGRVQVESEAQTNMIYSLQQTCKQCWTMFFANHALKQIKLGHFSTTC